MARATSPADGRLPRSRPSRPDLTHWGMPPTEDAATGSPRASASSTESGVPSDLLARSALETIDPEHYGNALGPLGGIAIETVDGGTLRGVSVSNVVMQGVRAPIFVRRANRASLQDPSAVPGT